MRKKIKENDIEQKQQEEIAKVLAEQKKEKSALITQIQIQAEEKALQVHFNI